MSGAPAHSKGAGIDDLPSPGLSAIWFNEKEKGWSMLLQKPLSWVQDVAQEVQSHWCSHTPLLGKPSSTVHCQRKRDHSWCGGSKWLWHSLGAWEVQLRRWELETGPEPWGWQYHPQLQKWVSLTVSCCILCSGDKHLHAVSPASRPAVLFQGLHSLKAHTHNPRCCRLLWGSTVLFTTSTSILWITQLGRSLPCNQEHLMAHPWPAHGAVSPIREEETGIGWDLHLWAIHLTGTYHTNISSSQEGFATPQPHVSTFLPHFNLYNLQHHPTIPRGRWHTSPHTRRWDSFLLQRRCGCHHLSRPGIHVSTVQWAPQTGLLWKQAPCDTENQPPAKVIEEEGGRAVCCKELQCTPHLSPYGKGCDPGLAVCSLGRHCTAQGTGNYGTLSSGCWQYSLGQGTTLTQWH